MMHNGNAALADELIKRGVNCKGYGILFKYPMLDPELTIEAKGIYCYICSYAGSDSTAFPGRERIMSDLKMSKDAYYKHYQILLQNDYIHVHQENRGGNSHGFMKNVYEIVECPQKFKGLPNAPGHAEAYSKIRSGGLHQAGFGYIPRSVMVDTRLSVKAKALYGYYRSFSGAGDCACPEKRHLLYHLGISSKLYQRLVTELENLNYITVEQRHINGRLSVNEILINSIPDESRVGERQLRVIGTENFYSVQKQDTQIQETQNQEGQKQDTQKTDTNKKNKNKTNSVQKQSVQQQIRKETEDGQIKTNYFDFKKADREEVLSFVRELVDFKSREEEYGDLDSFSFCRHFTSALTDMLYSKRKMKLNGEEVTAQDVFTKLQFHIRQSADGKMMLMDVEENATAHFEFAMLHHEIQNPDAYFKACIWTELERGERVTS